MYIIMVWCFSFLHNSQWIIFLFQSYLVLCSFCAYLLHSLIIWLIVSSLSLHNLHLQFCCILFIFTLLFIGIMVRMFANSLGDWGSIPGWVTPKTPKWYLMLPCLALSIIRCTSRVKWSNPGNGVAPSPTPCCSSY